MGSGVESLRFGVQGSEPGSIQGLAFSVQRLGFSV